MEGTSQGSKERFRVYRKFECSRIEHPMLAEAYRKILPDNCLHLVERNNAAINHCNSVSQADLQEGSMASRHVVIAQMENIAATLIIGASG